MSLAKRVTDESTFKTEEAKRVTEESTFQTEEAKRVTEESIFKQKNLTDNIIVVIK